MRDFTLGGAQVCGPFYSIRRIFRAGNLLVSLPGARTLPFKEGNRYNKNNRAPAVRPAKEQKSIERPPFFGRCSRKGRPYSMKNEQQPRQEQAQARAQRLRTLAVDLVHDILGSILFAIGVYTFAKSADFAPGGVTGLALILNHLWQCPIGTATLALNLPIILLSYRVMGRKFLFKSFRTMAISTFFLDIVFPFTPVYTGNPLLAALFSGAFMGAGLALVYMRGSSTGGTDFLIFTVKKLRPHFSMGQVTLLIDLSVILLGGVFFRNIDALLYGVICTYAGSLIIDKMMYGAGSGKLAIIITKGGPAAARAIDAETSRGATLVKAIGAYSGAERHLVLCACSKSEIFKVRGAVHSIDESAFVMITEASEVFGEGFTPPQEEP